MWNPYCRELGNVCHGHLTNKQPTSCLLPGLLCRYRLRCRAEEAAGAGGGPRRAGRCGARLHPLLAPALRQVLLGDFLFSPDGRPSVSLAPVSSTTSQVVRAPASPLPRWTPSGSPSSSSPSTSRGRGCTPRRRWSSWWLSRTSPARCSTGPRCVTVPNMLRNLGLTVLALFL